ncbi:MAG: septation protein SepH [Mycobacteriales bacterium]
MRELHVVAVSEDGRHVLLAARRGSAKGAFKVALDATLAAAVRGDLPRPGDDEIPDISPKEIQARLRTGESVEQIARAAGVPAARVARYSGPVQGEMARVIDATRSAYVVRGRLGRSAVDLGTAVDAALEHGGADLEDTDWSTHRREDGSWLVTVRWFARKRSRTASWVYDPAQRVVTPTDPASAALAHQESEEATAKRRPPAAPRKAAAARAPEKGPAKKAPANKAPANKVAAKKATASKVAAKKAPASKVAAKKAPASKAAAKKATANKAAAKRPTTKQAAPVKRGAPVRKPVPVKTAPAAKRAAVKKAVGKPATRPHRALRVVPDPEPLSRKGSASKQRASVPAWADVLLGTTPGADR